MSTSKTTVQELAEKWSNVCDPTLPYEFDTRWWLRAIADVLEKKAVGARVGEFDDCSLWCVIALLREEAEK